MNPSDILWSGFDEDESLSCETPEEAAIEYIEETIPEGPDEDEGQSITVYEYKRKPIDKAFLERQIKNNLEEVFNEEYGDPEGDCAELPNSVVVAIGYLVGVIERDMSVYWMERTGKSITKTIKEWRQCDDTSE